MSVAAPFLDLAPVRPADGLCLLRLPARSSGYEVAQVVWHVERRGFPLVALETLLRTPALADGRTLADRLETRGVFARAERSHLAACLEVRGPADAVRGAIGELARTLADAEPEPRAVRSAVSRVAGAVEKSGLSLPVRADRALHAAYAGSASPFGEHPEGPAAVIRALGAEQVGESLAVLRRAPVSVLYSDPLAEDEWARALAPFAGRQIVEPAEFAATGPGSRVGADGLGDVRVALPGLRGAHVLWGFVAEVGTAGTADAAAEVRTAGTAAEAGTADAATEVRTVGTTDETDGLVDHVAAEVAAHALGGWWQARWQQLFREELGVTYGTRTRVEAFRVGARTYSLAAVGMTLGAVDRGGVVQRLRAEAARFLAEGLTEQECRASAGRLARAEALHAESGRALSARMAQPLLNGLAPGFHQVRQEWLAGDPDPAEVGVRVRRLVEPSVIVVAEGEES